MWRDSGDSWSASPLIGAVGYFYGEALGLQVFAKAAVEYPELIGVYVALVGFLIYFVLWAF